MGFNSAFKGLKLLKRRERAFKQFKWPRPQCVNKRYRLLVKLTRIGFWPTGHVAYFRVAQNRRVHVRHKPQVLGRIHGAFPPDVDIVGRS